MLIKMTRSDQHIEDIAQLLEGDWNKYDSNEKINTLLTDSRLLGNPVGVLFFALDGRINGKTFIPDLIEKGVRNFVVSDNTDISSFSNVNLISVKNTLFALQLLAAKHRSVFHYPVIGIAGSNGKTIVKDWLYQLLSTKYRIVRSPKSYNSQIGVPLSVWQMAEENELAIIETGISQVGEMERLETIVKPDIVLFTNLGSAHDDGFANREQKFIEKIKLASNSSKIFINLDLAIEFSTQIPKTSNTSWSFFNSNADLFVQEVKKQSNETIITAVWKNEQKRIKILFSDSASIENAILCWSVLLDFKLHDEFIETAMLRLQGVAMRLQQLEGIHETTIINDGYNFDLESLTIALDYLMQQKQHPKRTVILSDLPVSEAMELDYYRKLAQTLNSRKVDRLIGIGNRITAHSDLFDLPKRFFTSTEDFLKNVNSSEFANESVLVKGQRKFEFERISKFFQQKTHQTVLEINLNAIVHNLNYYRSQLSAETKIMVMVKAFSYGSGSFEIANLLQFHRVDYLAVAYADEGVSLRIAGITLPIMVMSPDENSFDSIIKYNIEPELFSFRILNKFIESVKEHGKTDYPIHLKIDTGMHRLGFELNQLDELNEILKNCSEIKIQSVFSHFAASDDEEQINFSHQQFRNFLFASAKIKDKLSYPILRHMANTAAIDHPEYKAMEMVRLGIGLYGIETKKQISHKLQTVATLKTTIAQIRMVLKGDTIGYGRRGIADKDLEIAVVKIGYADGYSRLFSNGIGTMRVNGKLAKIIGSVCMDMCMLDVSGLGATEGEEVIVFDEILTVSNLAEKIATIPYEIISTISQRVQRIYYYE